MNTINKSIKEALFRAYNTRNRNNKNQKRFDVIFGTIFCLCIIMTIAAFGLMGANVKAGVIMLLVIFLCFGAAVTYALLRKKRIMKLLYSVPVGAENIEKIDVKQVVSVVITSTPILKSALKLETPGPTNSITLFLT